MSRFKWTDSGLNGIWSLRDEVLAILGTGNSPGEAIEDYINNVIAYSEAYVNDLDHHLKNDNPSMQNYDLILDVVKLKGDRGKLIKHLGIRKPAECSVPS